MSIWTTPDRAAELAKLWPLHSASVIARMLGTTRNSVIGAAHRADLPPKAKATRKAPPRRQRAMRKRPKIFTGPRFWRPPEPPPLPPAPPVDLDPSLHRTVLEIEHGCCKWPVVSDAEGRGWHLFCGAPAAKVAGLTSSYCAAHFVMAGGKLR